MRARGQLQRSAISSCGRPCDEDAHIWPDGEPSFDELLAAEVRELGGDDASRVTFLTGVAQRLRGELHMPAVREALGCLIPESLHPRLDGKKPRGVKGDAERVGVHLEAGRWALDVSAENALAVPGRAMSNGALEFFFESSSPHLFLLGLASGCWIHCARSTRRRCADSGAAVSRRRRLEVLEL